MSRFLPFLALLSALVAPAAALEIKSDARPGALPSITAPGEIAINRADGRFFYRDEAGNRAGGLLPDLDPNGYLKFRNGMTLGRYQGGKFVSQPDEVQSKGPISALGGLSVAGIAHVNMGTSSVPAGLLETTLAGAWPSLVIRNNSRDPASQTQLFLEKLDPVTGERRIWQLAHDVENNGGWPSLFNIEAVNPVTGVISTPFGAARSGEVSLGGLPIAGVQASVRGIVRSYDLNASSTFGRFDFGKTGSNYIIGDTAAGYVATYVQDTSSLVLTANGANVSGALSTGGYFGANGATPLAPVALPPAATDAATTMALVNKIREALLKSGLAVAQ